VVLVVVNSGDSTVDILRGNGDGTFQTAASYQLSQQPTSVAVADFNVDGYPDIAVSFAQDSRIAVLMSFDDQNR
jgi:hypothetical protein